MPTKVRISHFHDLGVSNTLYHKLNTELTSAQLQALYARYLQVRRYIVNYESNKLNSLKQLVLECRTFYEFLCLLGDRELLQRYQVDITRILGNLDQNALHLLALSGNLATFQWACEKMSKDKATSLDYLNRSILDYAAWSGSKPLIEWVLQEYPQLKDNKNLFGSNFLVYLGLSGHPESATWLTEFSTKIESSDDTSLSLMTLLSFYARGGNEKALTDILSTHSNFTQDKDQNQDPKGNHFLLYLALSCSPQTFKKFSQGFFPVNYSGVSVVHFAALGNNIPLLYHLKVQGINLTLTSFSGRRNILHYACMGGALSTVKWICKNYPHLHYKKDIYGKNIAHYAVVSGFLPLIHYLYEKYPYLFIYTDYNANTIWHSLAECLNIYTIKEFILTYSDKLFPQLKPNHDRILPLFVEEYKNNTLFHAFYTIFQEVITAGKNSPVYKKFLNSFKSLTCSWISVLLSDKSNKSFLHLVSLDLIEHIDHDLFIGTIKGINLSKNRKLTADIIIRWINFIVLDDEKLRHHFMLFKEYLISNPKLDENTILILDALLKKLEEMRFKRDDVDKAYRIKKLMITCIRSSEIFRAYIPKLDNSLISVELRSFPPAVHVDTLTAIIDELPKDIEEKVVDTFKAVRRLSAEKKEIVEFVSANPYGHMKFENCGGIILHTEKNKKFNWNYTVEDIDRRVEDFIAAYYIAKDKGMVLAFYDRITRSLCLDGRMEDGTNWAASIASNALHTFEQLFQHYYRSCQAYFALFYGRNYSLTLTDVVTFIVEVTEHDLCLVTNYGGKLYGKSGKLSAADVKEYCLDILCFDDDTTEPQAAPSPLSATGIKYG